MADSFTIFFAEFIFLNLLSCIYSSKGQTSTRPAPKESSRAVLFDTGNSLGLAQLPCDSTLESRFACEAGKFGSPAEKPSDTSVGFTILWCSFLLSGQNTGNSHQESSCVSASLTTSLLLIFLSFFCLLPLPKPFCCSYEHLETYMQKHEHAAQVRQTNVGLFPKGKHSKPPRENALHNPQDTHITHQNDHGYLISAACFFPISYQCIKAGASQQSRVYKAKASGLDFFV